MNIRRPHIWAVVILVAAVSVGSAAPLPVLDDKPVLQVDPGGPSAAVTALAFSPDGDTLYLPASGVLGPAVNFEHATGLEPGKQFRAGPGFG